MKDKGINQIFFYSTFWYFTILLICQIMSYMQEVYLRDQVADSKTFQ